MENCSVSRHLDRRRDQGPFRRIRDRHRRQEGLGVGMQRLVVKRARRCQLHDPAEIHHRDARTDVFHHRQVERRNTVTLQFQTTNLAISKP